MPVLRRGGGMSKVITRAEAKARGLTRYFTGKPCKNGHIAYRLASNGLCRDCRVQIKRRDYAKNSSKYCAAKREWRKANPEKTKLEYKKRITYRKDWARKNRDKRRQYAESYVARVGADVVRKKHAARMRVVGAQMRAALRKIKHFEATGEF